MDRETLAYLAGVMDSDGCFTIRRSTYAKRKEGATNATFAGRVSVKQVTHEAVDLLQETFGGSRWEAKPSIKTGRPLQTWEATCSSATDAAKALLPFLRIKRRQAELLVELASTMDPKYRRVSYWYGDPDPSAPVYTVAEAAMLKGVKASTVRQSISKGSVPAIRVKRRVFIPRDFWDKWIVSKSRPRPPQLIEWRRRLYDEIRSLNSPNGAKRTRAG